MIFFSRIGSQPSNAEIQASYPVFVRCKRCLHWYEVDKSNSLTNNNYSIRKNSEPKLCSSCQVAKKSGYHNFHCDGCKTEISGTFKQVRLLLNVFGKAFCHDCRTAFFGSCNPLNPALNTVLGCIAEKRKLRSMTVWGSEEQNRLHQQACKYYNLVRRLSRSNYKSNIQILNPKNYSFGPSGRHGCYHLDHIVPVTICWEHYVPAEEAASVQNLQIIPWFVNVSRGNYFKLAYMIGWPIKKKKKKIGRKL